MTGSGRLALAALGTLVALAVTRNAHALDASRLPTQQMRDAWSELDGLPQNSVKAIAQTPDGFLWIGTEEGLVRFDGASFVVFDRTNTSGRAASIVDALAVDANGELLVLDRRDGLCVARVPTFACTPLPGGAVGKALRIVGGRALVLTDQGVFVRTADGLRRDDALGSALVRDVAGSDVAGLVAVTQKGLVRSLGSTTQPIELGELSPEDVTTVTRMRSGVVWVGTRRGPYLVEGRRIVPASGDGNLAGTVSFVAEDKAGNVWLAIFDDGLYRSAPGGRFVRVPLSKAQPSERLDAFFEDDEGNVWIGSRLSGLHRLRDGPFLPWGQPEGIAHGYVSAVLAAPDGTVFLGSGGGGVYTVRDGRVAHFGAAEGLPSDEISALALAGDGSVVVGTRRGVGRIRSGDASRAETLPIGTDLVVMSVLDEGDELWVGTATALHATKRKKVWGAAEGLPEWIAALHRGHDGSLWIATANGLARLRGDVLDRPFHDRLGHTTLTSFLERDGALYFGTNDAGLFHLKSDALAKLDREGGLFDDTVHTMVDGLDGRMWMTCNKGVFATPFAEIDAYLDRREARVSTSSFGRLDGMRSRECNGGMPGSARDPRRRLWFATMLGAVSVDPHALDVPRPPRIPVIETARIAGQTFLRPSRVSLPSDARAIDIAFTSPALAGAERLVFDVRLKGRGDDWHEASGRAVSFAGLSPGNYLVEVRARDNRGQASASSATLEVDVPPRFVETTIFRGGVAVAAAGLLLAAVLARLRATESARKRLAALVEAKTAELAGRNGDLEKALEDLKRAETDLVRAERMASVATMVRGIAHELNNPLAFVTGNVVPLRKYTEFLLRAVREVDAGEKKLSELRLGSKKDLAFVEKDLRALLADMEEGGRRAKLIVGDLQSLTDSTSRAVEPVDLSRVVHQSVRLLAASKPETVAIEIDAPAAPPVHARAGEIEQAVANLVDNALRAVGPHGRIHVSARVEDGTGVVVVADDGPGMNEETKRRATEPFFTTRRAGEGSGLGLAIVARIAEHHGGSVTIDSEPGKGTRITLTVRRAM